MKTQVAILTGIKWSLITFSAATLSACGGGGSGGGQPNHISISSGQFVDSPVQGLQYSYAALSLSGVTNANGNYPFRNGESIVFSIGDIELGMPRTAYLLMNPVSVANSSSEVTDNSATNVARFLQILDEDGDTSNGIVITQNVRDLAVGKTINFSQTPTDFENDGNVQTVVAELTAANGVARTLTEISVVDAQQHVTDTMDALTSSMIGTYSGTSDSDFVGCSSQYVDTVAKGSIEVTSIVPDNFPVVGNYGLSANGSFTAKARGVTVKEYFDLDATLQVTGVFTGTLYAEAYVDGDYAGGGSKSVSGFFNSTGIIIELPTDNFGNGCVRYGEVVVKKN